MDDSYVKAGRHAEKAAEAFLGELKELAPGKYDRARANWADYLPELKKCQTREEVCRLLLSFFERSLRSVAKDLEAKEFHRLRYDTVGKLMKCMYAMHVNKNTIKDYIKHLHSTEGKPLERGIRMADEKPYETPDEIGTREGEPRKGESRKGGAETREGEPGKGRAGPEAGEGGRGEPITLSELKARISGGERLHFDRTTVAAALFALFVVALFLFRLFF
jgi:hypothetical protein